MVRFVMRFQKKMILIHYCACVKKDLAGKISLCNCVNTSRSVLVKMKLWNTNSEGIVLPTINFVCARTNSGSMN